MVKYTAEVRMTLGEHLTYTDPRVLSRVDIMTRGMMSRGADAFTARERALSLLDRQVLGQASVIAYSRIYVLAALLILMLIPLLLLVRKPAANPGGDHIVME